MKIFALSDLHLSLAQPRRAGDADAPQLYKPMDRFGALWQDYFARLEQGWQQLVAAEDAVLIAGDISWAMGLQQARLDLDYIASLPGRKLLVKGNHDYWWQSLSQLREILDGSISVLQHSAVDLGAAVVCGTRGWLCPTHADWREDEDRHIYDRELLRLEMALQEAAALAERPSAVTPQQAAPRPIIAMLHYPPLDDSGQASEVCQLLSRYRVSHCVYGHIHGDKKAVFEGLLDGVCYYNCSIDRLGFRPKLILDSDAPPISGLDIALLIR